MRAWFLVGLVACAPSKPAEPLPPPPSIDAGAVAQATRAPLECAGSERCKTSGECTGYPDFGARECIVASDADCQRSEACTLHEKCVARGGAVGKTCNVPCRKTEECAESGACADEGGLCVARSAADCARSAICKSSGACGFDGTSCVPTSAAHCLVSTRCRDEGACLFRQGLCLTKRALQCNCPPSATGGAESMRLQKECLDRGGAWGPLCGPPPP